MTPHGKHQEAATGKPMLIQHASLLGEWFLSTQKLSDEDADRIASALHKK